jgi:hypothetical protein
MRRRLFEASASVAGLLDCALLPPLLACRGIGDRTQGQSDIHEQMKHWREHASRRSRCKPSSPAPASSVHRDMARPTVLAGAGARWGDFSRRAFLTPPSPSFRFLFGRGSLLRDSPCKNKVSQGPSYHPPSPPFSIPPFGQAEPAEWRSPANQASSINLDRPSLQNGGVPLTPHIGVPLTPHIARRCSQIISVENLGWGGASKNPAPWLFRLRS